MLLLSSCNVGYLGLLYPYHTTHIYSAMRPSLSYNAFTCTETVVTVLPPLLLTLESAAFSIWQEPPAQAGGLLIYSNSGSTQHPRPLLSVSINHARCRDQLPASIFTSSSSLLILNGSDVSACMAPTTYDLFKLQFSIEHNVT